MMRKVLLVSLVLALLLLAVPVVAFAATPVEVKVQVRNHTTGIAEVRVTDEFGNNLYYSFEPGLTEISLTEGKYQAYISTVCGTSSDTWYVDKDKVLYIECGAAAPVVQYRKCHLVGTLKLQTLRGNFPERFPNLDGYIDLEGSHPGLLYEVACRYGILPEDIVELRVLRLQ